MSEISQKRPLRVCYFGTYRANYSRNQILLKGLRTQGVEIYECHAKLWQSVEDRVQQASGGWRNPRFWGRVINAYWRLLRAHNRTPKYDVMLIGYPGQFDAYLGRLLTWWRRKPMALDILMSLHLVAEERGLTEKSPLTGRLVFLLEKIGLHLPDLLIAENLAYQEYIRLKYNLPSERFRRVPHGADDSVFHPRPAAPPVDSFQVTYHGLYLPSHGLDAVISGAELLKHNPEIHFNFYGNGPERARIEAYATEHKLANVHFHGFVSRDELLDGIAQSHVCLGVFGTTKQSNFTIQNKVWEGLAMGQAVVSGISDTIEESLTHKEHIYLIDRDNPQALAEALLELKGNPKLRQHIAAAGYQRFVQGNAVAAIGRSTLSALLGLSERDNQ